MAVKIKEETIDNLTLDINNGDLSKLKEVVNKYSFKDYQSFLRFSVSILLLNEKKSIGIRTEGKNTEVVPDEELLK